MANSKRADLGVAVKQLTAAATDDVDPKALRPKVEAALSAFDGATDAARLAAVKALGAALAKASGRGSQVLALALGAMVEGGRGAGGALAEAAWPAVSKGLAATLEHATAFAHAVTAAAGGDDLESALGTHGAVVAVVMPAEAAAWKAMSARCLVAVSCLARSKAVRARARKTPSLAEAAWQLSDAVGEVGALLQALGVLDDAEFEIADPTAKKTWRVVVDGVASNAELYLAVAHVAGAKLAADVIPSLLAGETPAKKRVVLPFTLGVDPEGDPTETPRRLTIGRGSTTIDTAHLPVLDGLRLGLRAPARAARSPSRALSKKAPARRAR